LQDKILRCAQDFARQKLMVLKIKMKNDKLPVGKQYLEIKGKNISLCLFYLV